jgi:hypothetical protein
MTNGCKMIWNFFDNGHGKGPHDGVGVVTKGLFEKHNLMPTVPNCKMQRRLSNTCVNICHTNQRHHIVVQEGLCIGYFDW